MATLHLHEVSDKVAQAYLNTPPLQQQRLKRIVEEAILLWTEASSRPATSSQSSEACKNETLIRHTQGVCGGNACIRNTRIPVWTLASLRSQGATDNELLKDYPSIVQSDLDAAWVYYQDHKNEIDQAIAAQDNED